MKSSLRWTVIAGVALALMTAVVYLVQFQNVKPGTPGSNNTPPHTLADLPEYARQRFMWGYNRGLQELMPIRLYGKVVDQDGSGVPGVKIAGVVTSFDISALKDLSRLEPKHTPIDVASDAAGLFSITGLRGSGLQIVGIKKDGYEADPAAQHWFNYSDHYGEVYQPDQANPLVFKMWRKGKGESLATMDKNTSILCDGRTYTLDLLMGQVVDGATNGDLRIQVNATVPTEITVRTYPWSCVIEAEDGGILETTDAFLYRPPQDGYQPSFTSRYDPSTTGWSPTFHKRFYVRSRGGKVFAGVDLQVDAGRLGEGMLIVKSRANPAGSPNLQ